MEDVRLDEHSLCRAVQFTVDTGTAMLAGEAFAAGLAERLEPLVRRLEAAAAPVEMTEEQVCRSRRDELAAMAMQCLCGCDSELGGPGAYPARVAALAYQIADAMLARGAMPREG